MLKRRVGGGLLVMALGGVLLGSGLSSSAAGTVGEATTTTSTVETTTTDPGETTTTDPVETTSPVATPCQTLEVGGMAACPEGSIAITDGAASSAAARAARALPHALPASWTITITSSCALPGGSSSTVVVPVGGTATSDPLFVYTTSASTTKCSYALTETPVAGYTASFQPASPVTLPASRTGLLQVRLTNTAVTATTSSVSPTSTSVAPSASPSVAPSGATTVGGSLPFTGPRHGIAPTVYVGIALLVGGLFLVLMSGRIRPRTARHRDS